MQSRLTGTAAERGLVSVVIATYNCRRYVCDAIDSVLNQTYPRLDVHVVDDGSNDGTDAALARFAQDARVHCHRQANAGQTRAKNRGIAASRGEFVAFCDADDLWLPDKLEVQLPRFEDSRVGVVYARSARIDAAGAPVAVDTTDEPPRPSGRVTEALFERNFVPFGTAVVRRQCFEDLGAFDERYAMAIDWELWLRLSVAYEFAFVDRDTYRYRVWPGQMSHNWRGRYEHAFRIMREFQQRHGHALSRETKRRAWADSYTQRARQRAHVSADFAGAFADAVRALSIDPGGRAAWKTLGAIALAAAGGRPLAQSPAAFRRS